MCAYVRDELRARRVEVQSKLQDTKDLWFAVTMDSGLSINICACYHPPKSIYDVPSFKQHLAHSISLLIDNDPEAIFILTGDLNRLNTSALQTNLGLVQIVNIPTHNNNIFNQFITN